MGTEHAEGDADRGSSPGTALLDEAMRLYEELSSANSEHPYRTVPLGIAMGLTLLDAGRQDDGEAVLGNAAEMGVPYAAALLSRVLERRGASPDEVEAWDRLERERPREPTLWPSYAFEIGAMFGRLGDAEAAIRWCQEAAEGGDLDGMNDLGAFLRERGRVDEAEAWFRRAAIAGHVIAADNLRRVLWKRGIRPGQIGWTEEAKWFVPAAEAGSTIAANWLAVAAAQLGKPELAEQWGLWAAELGDPDAAYARGLRLGRRKEYDESERWLERAAAGGHKKAAALLAEPRAARRGRPNFPG